MTSSTGALLCPGLPVATRLPIATSTIKLLRMPARRPVPGALLFVWRVERAAALVGIGAARRERAARRQVGQRRHLARDLLETAVGRRADVAPAHREMRAR